jgi:predicted phosphohydrolase
MKKGGLPLAVYTIGDLHLSLGGNKSMESFAGWQDYVSRIERNWRATVAPEDTVVLLGDTSWAVKPQELEPDLRFIESLPGQKVLIKGNHDYWWSTRSKMEAMFAELGFTSIHIMHNSCYPIGDMAVCGTRGWMIEEQTPHDRKLSNREAGRLEASLQEAVRLGKRPVAFLHYPPIFLEQMSGNIIDLLIKYKVQRCYYAHLHATACQMAFRGEYMGINFQLVSADCLNFALKLVEC